MLCLIKTYVFFIKNTCWILQKRPNILGPQMKLEAGSLCIQKVGALFRKVCTALCHFREVNIEGTNHGSVSLGFVSICWKYIVTLRWTCSWKLIKQTSHRSMFCRDFTAFCLFFFLLSNIYFVLNIKIQIIFHDP